MLPGFAYALAHQVTGALDDEWAAKVRAAPSTNAVFPVPGGLCISTFTLGACCAAALRIRATNPRVVSRINEKSVSPSMQQAG